MYLQNIISGKLHTFAWIAGKDICHYSADLHHHSKTYERFTCYSQVQPDFDLKPIVTEWQNKHVLLMCDFHNSLDNIIQWSAGLWIHSELVLVAQFGLNRTNTGQRSTNCLFQR